MVLTPAQLSIPTIRNPRWKKKYDLFYKLEITCHDEADWSWKLIGLTSKVVAEGRGLLRLAECLDEIKSLVEKGHWQ